MALEDKNIIVLAMIKNKIRLGSESIVASKYLLAQIYQALYAENPV
jgi:hypothetical protein